MDVNVGVCAVTGANGYVGKVITRHLEQGGWRVYAVVRPHRNGGLKNTIPFSLEAGLDPESLKGMQALVHCAYSFRQIRWRDIRSVNIEGTRKVMESAAVAGIKKIIFLSSVAAYDGSKSLYGKAKREMEELALNAGATVIRPGLVYGPNAGGLFGALRRITSLSRVIPLIDRGNQRICLAHEEDLAKLVLKVLQRPDRVVKPIVAGSEDRKTFRQLVEALSEASGRKLILIPTPSTLILAGLRVMEAAGIRLGYGSDNLISFLNPNPTPDFTAAREMGVSFREFNVRSLVS